MGGKNLVKISVNLSSDIVDALKQMADDHGTSMTEMLRRAVSTQFFLEKEAHSGHKILIEDEDKNIRQVVFR